MTDTASEPTGFWSRLSRRGKIIIVIDVVVLVVLIGVGAVYIANSRSDSRPPTVAAPSTSTSPIQAPLQTSYGLAWVVAACGGPMILNDLPDSPLPRAQDSAVCLAPGGGAAIAIGVYDDQATLDDDVADVRRAHRYATRIDEAGNVWLVLVEGDSAAPLQPLERYGFQLQ